MTPSQARNAIRKALTTIIDPKPKKKEIDAMWSHFNSSCAFCGITLDRKSRKGHADHLVPAAGGGSNHIFNRVLACAACNGDEKLDLPWDEFLQSKSSPNEADYEARKKRIDEWRERHRAQCSVDCNDFSPALEAAEKVILIFNQACEDVRKTKNP